jgi:hypothetical protein
MNPTVLNGGNTVVKYILFYLIFADSFKYFVVYKQRPRSLEKENFSNLLSNLVAFSIMLQLCIAYFGLGLTKLLDPYWQNGEAVYYTLLNEQFMGTPYNEWLARHKWFDYLANYSTLFFELLFPVLIWFKKLRPPLLIIGIVFHLWIYVFMMIHGFEILFILMYGMFLPNDLLLKYAHKIKTFIGVKQGALNKYMGLNEEIKSLYKEAK